MAKKATRPATKKKPPKPGAIPEFHGTCGCGSSLFFSDSNEATISLCPGALTSPTGLESQSHIFIGSKPDWYEVKDGLPQHLKS